MSPLTVADVKHALNELRELAYAASTSEEDSRDANLFRILHEVANIEHLLKDDFKSAEVEAIVDEPTVGAPVGDVVGLARALQSKARSQ